VTLSDKIVAAAVFGAISMLSLEVGATGVEPLEPITFEFGEPHVRLEVIGTYRTGLYHADAAEIAGHDPGTQRLFIVNMGGGGAVPAAIDVVDMRDPTRPSLLFAIDVSTFGVPTSVAVKNGIVAVALVAPVPTDPGTVALFDVDGNLLADFEVGTGPDMVTFTPDGRYLLAANTAEAGEDEPRIDPEGSVSIIEIFPDLADARVATADFRAFDDRRAELIEQGVRILDPDAAVSQDLQPEYIALTPDSRFAWVSLQDNNALAKVVIKRAEVTQIRALGTKDHSLTGNGFDASDRDDAINIAEWPVHGIYQPDAIAAYRPASRTFLVTANEGASRNAVVVDDMGERIDENVRVNELQLDPAVFPDRDLLQEDQNLGRLEVSRIGGDPDGDGLFERLLAFGARSFSIWDTAGRQVFDSGDDFERVTAVAAPEIFNTADDENQFDSRSNDQGPEPDGVAVGEIDGRYYAFVALERTGGIMVYDVHNPRAPRFQQYINNRSVALDPDDVCVELEPGDALVPESPECAATGDLGPEGVLFIAEDASPIRAPLVVITNQISGSTTIYRVDREKAVSFPHS
jgi:2',3'-cyclic-nucleotide 2'-phosphodiesterase / 3'-nucleotidase / 5'-nucleotidase